MYKKAYNKHCKPDRPIVHGAVEKRPIFLPTQIKKLQTKIKTATVAIAPSSAITVL
jgi:hypothetical protein